MNRKQQVAVVVGVVVIVLLFLFPSWKERAEESQGLTYFRGEELGRAWILQPPESGTRPREAGGPIRTHAGIDWRSQLLWTWIVLMFAISLVSLFGKRWRWPRPRGRETR